MNYKQLFGNYIYELTLEEIINNEKQLKIIMKELKTMKHFMCIVNNSDLLIKNHNIIKNVDLLYDILVTQLKSNNDSIHFILYIENTIISLHLIIKYEFISDKIVLEFNLMDNTKDLNNEIKQLNIKINKLENEIKLLKMNSNNTIDFDDYIIMPYSGIGDVRFIKDIQINNNKLLMDGYSSIIKTNNNKLDDNSEIDMMNYIDKFIIFKNLTSITIKNSKITSLKYFKNNKHLNSLIIENCDLLVDVSNINNFKHLNTLQIKNCKHIMEFTSNNITAFTVKYSEYHTLVTKINNDKNHFQLIKANCVRNSKGIIINILDKIEEFINKKDNYLFVNGFYGAMFDIGDVVYNLLLTFKLNNMIFELEYKHGEKIQINDKYEFLIKK